MNKYQNSQNKYNTNSMRPRSHRVIYYTVYISYPYDWFNTLAIKSTNAKLPVPEKSPDEIYSATM